MNDLISRQAAIDAVKSISDSICEQQAIDALCELPSIDAVPVEKYVPERNVGEWDMFDLITSAYYGKTMYFKQDNGIVYSRYSCKYMSVDEAIREFLALIGGDIE